MIVLTLPENNGLPLAIHGWKLEDVFPFGMAYF